LKVIYTIFLFIIAPTAFSQPLIDTINFKPVEIIDNKIPASFKISSFDSVSLQQSANLSDLITTNSSVFIKSYGLGSLSSISFRGTGASHTKVLWNGVALNSPMNGQIDFSLYPTLFFDNAELHYGASGLIDGDGALGGSVVLNNQEQFNKQTKITLNQIVGSFGTYTTGFKLKTGNALWFYETQLYGKKAQNNYSYTNITLKNNPTENLENAVVNQYGIQQAIYRKFKNSTLGTRIWYFNSDRELPSNLTRSELTNENQQDESYRALIEWKGLATKFQYKISSAFVKELLIYENNAASMYSKNNSYIFDNNINTSIYFDYKFKFTNNLNINYEIANTDSYAQEYNRLNASWLLGINKIFNSLSIDIFNRTMMVGETFKNLAPGVGSQLKLFKKEDFFVKANAGINYHYPTFNDLYWNPGGNENLKPEYAKMLEGGLCYAKSINQFTLNTEITTFYSYVKDWIIWLPTFGNYWSPTNLKEVENKGIEFALNLSTHLKKLNFMGKINYAYTESTNMNAASDFDNSVNKQLIYVPYHKLSSTLQLKYKSLQLIYTYNYTGELFITTDNNWYLPAIFISDISISNQFIVQPTWSISGSFSVNNIINQEYQSVANRPMPGRNYLLSVFINFTKP